jgi:hypothetical protein
MTLLSEAFKDKRFDVRMTERQLQTKSITLAEIHDNENHLEDDEHNSCWTSVEDLQKTEEELAKK